MGHAFWGDPLPHSACQPCAEVMHFLLTSANIKSRIIYGFNLINENILGHTFLEAFNPSTKKREVYDPDYGIYLSSIVINRRFF